MNPNIELIERYLSGDLSNAEKENFEQALAQDPELQRQLEQVKQLKEGIQYMALKDLIGKGFKKFKLWKRVKLISLLTIITAALFFAAAYAYHFSQGEEYAYYIRLINNFKKSHTLHVQTTSQDSLAFVKDHSEQMLSTDLELQYVSMDNDLDTIIESRNGMIILIPAGALVDEQGETVKGKVTYAFQEALEPEQIMLAGLSTTSDGKLLETGGMFQIAAHQNGKLLKINPDKKIMIKIPADHQKPNMQLFKGEKNKDGRINWVNPQPLSPDLIPVDIESLDFYPPNYIKALNDLGLYRHDKKYLDSLYYSFSGRKPDDCCIYPRIEPVTIQTIWKPKFNNTLLATKEFEERLRYLHKTCQNKALELYINNLNKNLHEVDSMVARMLDEEEHRTQFETFASQRLGKVRMNATMAKLLSKFYTLKKQRNKEVLEESYISFRNRKKAMELELEKLENKGQKLWEDRIAEVLREEIKFNTASVYKQLGLKPCEKQTVASYYTVEISNLDIYNIDRFVDDVSTNRTSGSYTLNGKTAYVKYKECSVEDVVADTFDKVLAYFIPNEVQSYILAERSGNLFKARLNEGMTYNFLEIKIADNKYYLEEGILNSSCELEKSYCRQVQKDELQKILSKIQQKNQARAIFQEFENQASTLFLEKMIEKIQVDQHNIDHLEGKIFPCEGRSQVNRESDSKIHQLDNPCHGKELYENNCTSCHTLHKTMVGPALNGILERRSMEWIIAWVKNPAKIIASGDPYAKKLAADYQSAGVMTAFGAMSDQDIKDIIAFVSCNNDDSLDLSQN